MVISIASQKGGTGKTSTSISLAAGLAHQGKRVLLVDIDSQANSSKVLLHHYPKIPKEQTIYATILNRLPLVIHETHVPNLSIVPSHILLSNTDIELTTAKDHRESRLKTELDRIKSQYDYVFIDNPPALGWLTLNAFTASDRVLVVVSPGYFELDREKASSGGGLVVEKRQKASTEKNRASNPLFLSHFTEGAVSALKRGPVLDPPRQHSYGG